jgi:hypothetical protein
MCLLKMTFEYCLHEQKWTRKSAISVCAVKIKGAILSSTEPVIGNVALVESPLVIHDTQPQDHQLPQSPLNAPSGDLDLPLQLWNQAHICCRLSPFQHSLILSQKCRPSGEKLGEFFKRRRMRHGLLASVSILCRETRIALLQAENESIT